MTMHVEIPAYIKHWEAYDDLYYKGEFEALVRLQKDYVKNRPDDCRELLLLADAYCYAGRYRAALKILKRLHVFDPYNSEYVQALVECLDGLKIDPMTFKWRRPIELFEDGKSACDWVQRYLQRSGVSDDACNLYVEMDSTGYARFDIEAFIEFLKADERFRVHEGSLEDATIVELSAWRPLVLVD